MSTDAGLGSVVLHIFRANRLDLQKSTGQLGPPLPKKESGGTMQSRISKCTIALCVCTALAAPFQSDRTESATAPPSSLLRQKPGHTRRNLQRRQWHQPARMDNRRCHARQQHATRHLLDRRLNLRPRHPRRPQQLRAFPHQRRSRHRRRHCGSFHHGSRARKLLRLR